MEDVPNTTQHLREPFAELQAAYQGKVALNLASENMLDSLFEDQALDIETDISVMNFQGGGHYGTESCRLY